MHRLLVQRIVQQEKPAHVTAEVVFEDGPAGRRRRVEAAGGGADAAGRRTRRAARAVLPRQRACAGAHRRPGCRSRRRRRGAPDAESSARAESGRRCRAEPLRASRAPAPPPAAHRCPRSRRREGHDRRARRDRGGGGARAVLRRAAARRRPRRARGRVSTAGSAGSPPAPTLGFDDVADAECADAATRSLVVAANGVCAFPLAEPLADQLCCAPNPERAWSSDGRRGLSRAAVEASELALSCADPEPIPIYDTADVVTIRCLALATCTLAVVEPAAERAPPAR